MIFINDIDRLYVILISMRPINTLSIFFFAYPAFKFNSYRCFIILINGILYHGIFPENLNMLKIDLFFNFFVFLYTGYYAPHHLNTAYLSIFLWIVNNHLLKRNYINNRTSEIIHGLTTHVPMSIVLYINLKEENLQKAII